MDSKDCVKRQAVTFTEAGKTGQDWDGGMRKGGEEGMKSASSTVDMLRLKCP